jgi:hypothetical protein
LNQGSFALIQKGEMRNEDLFMWWKNV